MSFRAGFRSSIPHVQAFPRGVRIAAPATPALQGTDDGTQRQRVDCESGLPVWLVSVQDPASAWIQTQTLTVEIVSPSYPQVPDVGAPVEFVGLTVGPEITAPGHARWTFGLRYRANAVVPLDAAGEDTQPLPLGLWLSGTHD